LIFFTSFTIVASVNVSLNGKPPVNYTTDTCTLEFCDNVLLFDLQGLDVDITHSLNVTNTGTGLTFDYVLVNDTGLPGTPTPTNAEASADHAK
jgi:hypothetical protein